MLQAKGCDGVFEINGSRCLPRKRRTRLTLARPRKPEWMDADTYASCPEEIVVRHVTRRRRGFRDKVLITTPLDEKVFSDDDIAELYQRRWDIETDFRSLKNDLDAGILSCRSADMIVKEFNVHLLACNLIRLLMSEAAAFSGASHTRSASVTRYNCGAPGQAAARRSTLKAGSIY